MTIEIAPHTFLGEPSLSFHAERTTDCDIHPLRGLIRFGPHSRGLLPDPIRVATIAPTADAQKLYDFMKELRHPVKPRERTEYLPPWPGFHGVFGIQIRGATAGSHIKLPASLDRDMQESRTPHVLLADQLARAIQQLEAARAEFEVLVIYLPMRWSRGFSRKSEDFNLHDHLKAITATRRIPLQIVREDKALSYFDRASVMWRIGLALYAKAGGVPWKLANVNEEVAYIGISYAVRPTESDRPRFVTCCSQVFDSGGSGLEFVAYDAHEIEITQRENPFLSRTEMFRVMTRSLDLYRRRHAGRTPKRVIVHKSTEFKRDEIDGCMEAFHLCEAVDLVQLIEDVGWRGVQFDTIGAKREATSFPVARGSVVQLGPREALLWLHGSVDGIDVKGPYFQGKRSTPQPIKLVRHAGHGPWDEAARAVLALSKMNWNNDALYDQLPVTMSYAHILARVVKRIPGLGIRPYQFRFFM